MANKADGISGGAPSSDELIVGCVSKAVLRTEGVCCFGGGFSDALSENLLGRELRRKGIKISEDEEGLTVDVGVVVRYGIKIPEISWNLQKNIKTELEKTADAAVKSVNIHVRGVRLADGEG
ncbi:MAG: Asp23/Gls24 family envelope stress response protein [Clostridiales Family XIII bacterium]|jgi:uncharacterized alkaline shock family protein YloU|nr:Asp23/Gls24 family envelope stress response protein [Clostridiales Family XIII bacterium]